MPEHHDSLIKTPKQLITIVALSFVIPIVIIALLVKFVTGGASGGAGADSMRPEAIADRLKPIGTVVLAQADGARTLQAGDAVYKSSCAACHTAGVAGAPKTADAAAWAPRLKQGLDTLVKHAVEGFKTMPAKGGNAELDPIEVARAVVFMANQSGASFKEPAAPAAQAGTPSAAAAPAAAPSPAPAATASAAPTAAAAAPSSAAASATSAEKLVQGACAACHTAGVAGAPKFGDKAAWAPRVKLGIDTLTASVIKGKGAMPPRGAAASASDAELRAAVEHMVAQVK